MKEDCCAPCVSSAARQSIAVAISLDVGPDRPNLKRLIKSSCVSRRRRMRNSESVSLGRRIHATRFSFDSSGSQAKTKKIQSHFLAAV